MTVRLSGLERLDGATLDALDRIGIATADELLDRCGTPAGREQLGQATGWDAQEVLAWARRFDLMRIKGVGLEYSELLVRSGVRNSAALAREQPRRLHAALLVGSSEVHIVRRPPSLNQITAWIDEAAELPAVDLT